MEALTTWLDQHPHYKLLGLDKLARLAKTQGASRKVVKQWFQSQALNQVFSQPKQRKATHRYKITAPPYSFQIDVIVVPKYKDANMGKDRFLLCVDILSRKAFAYVLPSNRLSDVLDKYAYHFLEDAKRKPWAVSGDDFFRAPRFLAFNKRRGIRVHTVVAKDNHTHNHIKATRKDALGIVDRCTRTLKQLIEKHAIQIKDKRWTRYLSTIVDLYNSAPHLALGNKTPNELYGNLKALCALNAKNKRHNQQVSCAETERLHVGDQVRVALAKRNPFSKESNKYSKTVYKISGREGYHFVLERMNGGKVGQHYMAAELLRVDEVEGSIEHSE
jgi:hypothetical protein